MRICHVGTIVYVLLLCSVVIVMSYMYVMSFTGACGVEKCG